MSETKMHAAIQLAAIRESLRSVLGTVGCPALLKHADGIYHDSCSQCSGRGTIDLVDTSATTVELIANLVAKHDQYVAAFLKSRRAHLALSEAIMPDIDYSERWCCTPEEATAIRERADAAIRGGTAS